MAAVGVMGVQGSCALSYRAPLLRHVLRELERRKPPSRLGSSKSRSKNNAPPDAAAAQRVQTAIMQDVSFPRDHPCPRGT